MNDYLPIDTATADLQQVELEIDRYRGRAFVTLPYPPPMEQRYESETALARRRHLTLFGLLGLFIYDAFLVGDYFMYPERFFTSLVVRIGVVTPVVLLLAWLLQKPALGKVREGGATLLCFLGCCSVLFLHSFGDISATLQAEPGVLMVLLCMNVVLRVDFAYALAGTAACLLVETGFLFHLGDLSTGNRLTIAGRIFWVGVLTLIANYSLAREQRMAWLQQLHGRVQGRVLAEVNAELVSLSATDTLTGLSNRYGYENRFRELWKAAIHRSEPISAVMVDVDHFKSLNDSFGHAYGDRVLSRVAALILQALRAEGDFAARVGGEEFIVLLPNSDEDAAFRVAERIRLLVQVAGSPAVRADAQITGDEHWSTVSCGTATIVPTNSSEQARLIEAADAAMYRAKRTGRNRVCSSPSLERDRGGLAIVSRTG